jgi:adhesin transport system membrane fusion protein
MATIHEHEFMNPHDAMPYLRGMRLPTLLLYTIFGAVVTFFIWASFARLDEITRGTGEVIPSINAQIIQSLEGGILQELLVREGSVVKKGDVIMRLRDVAFASEERGTEAKLLSLQLRKARLQAEVDSKDFAVDEALRAKGPQIAANEESLFQSRRKEYNNALDMLTHKINSLGADINAAKADIARNNDNIALLQKELAITSKMVAQKAVPEIEALRLRREISDHGGAVRSGQQKIASLQADLESARKQKEDQADKFHTQVLGELNETVTQLTGLEENLKSIGDRVDRTEIRSPVDGVVNNIALTTIGGVVESAMKLAEIVPAGDDVKIRARVMPSDIAFLTLGQKVRVKFTAYDSARYGYLDGELIRIGANSITHGENTYFEIEVRTTSNNLGTATNPLPITAGMMAEVNVITGSKTVLEYMMKPFLRLKDRAFTER